MANVVKYKQMGDLNMQGGVLFDPIDPADVPTPPSGKFVMFNDSTNSNKPSYKDDTGAVNEFGGGGGFAPIEIAKVTAFASDVPSNRFTDYLNNANIEPSKNVYDGGNTVLLSTSSNEPMGIDDQIMHIPTGATNLQFVFDYMPEDGTTWGGNTVVWKAELSKSNGSAWSSVVSKDIGTDTLPSSGSLPQKTTHTVSLATLGLAAGDSVQAVIFVSSSSTLTDDVAFQKCTIKAV